MGGCVREGQGGEAGTPLLRRGRSARRAHSMSTHTPQPTPPARFFGEAPPVDMRELHKQQQLGEMLMNQGGEGTSEQPSFPYSHEVPPEAIDWRDSGIISPIKNQHVNGSKCGCCFAFGGIAGVESANALYTGEVVTLSEQEVSASRRESPAQRSRISLACFLSLLPPPPRPTIRLWTATAAATTRAAAAGALPT